MITFTRLCCVAIFVALLAGSPQAAWSQSYQVKNLGDFGFISLGAINDDNQIAGTISSQQDPDLFRAAIWSSSTGVVALGGPGVAAAGVPTAISPSGRVVVGYAVFKDSSEHAVIWNDGVPTDINVQTHHVDGNRRAKTRAYSINGIGEVVGYYYRDSSNQRSFIYQSGAWGLIWDRDDCHAVAINSSAKVVGWCDLKGNAQRHAQNAVYRDYPNSKQTILDQSGIGIPTNDDPSRAKSDFIAVGVNSSSWIVGTAAFPDASQPQAEPIRKAVVWQPNQGIRDLGNLGGAYIYCDSVAINDPGQIIGICSDSYAGGGNSRPFIWDINHGIRDLNNLVSTNFGWRVTAVMGINGSGNIIAMGVSSNTGQKPQPILLTVQ
jgi:probable HAF family extracellular repeat protein